MKARANQNLDNWISRNQRTEDRRRIGIRWLKFNAVGVLELLCNCSLWPRSKDGYNWTICGLRRWRSKRPSFIISFGTSALPGSIDYPDNQRQATPSRVF